MFTVSRAQQERRGIQQRCPCALLPLGGHCYCPGSIQTSDLGQQVLDLYPSMLTRRVALLVFEFESTHSLGASSIVYESEVFGPEVIISQIIKAHEAQLAKTRLSPSKLGLNQGPGGKRLLEAVPDIPDSRFGELSALSPIKGLLKR